MNQTQKEAILHEAREQLGEIINHLDAELPQAEKTKARIQVEFLRAQFAEKLVQAELLRNAVQTVEAIAQLRHSPYFVRCDVYLNDEPALRIFRFAKFAFPEESIFSWTSPAATIRFEQPGEFHYRVDEKKSQHGRLQRKDQFMIANGTIRYLTHEAVDQPRELVYQEYFSQQKSSFVLPEIVEQMERAQDQVIRAHYQGPFLISGPAGSGKTTLALHRIAYLLQSPETAAHFDAQNMIVFLQDSSTKEYFGAVLPELGIHSVTLTTFAEWACGLLSINAARLTTRYGITEEEKDIYEYEKYQALEAASLDSTSLPQSSDGGQGNGDEYTFLQTTYEEHLSPSSQRLWERQCKQKLFDRFDLTLLLQRTIKEDGTLQETKTSYEAGRNNKAKRIIQQIPLRYHLMVVDEVQNYLPQQLAILRTCMTPETNALTYVGDLAQQTQLCTIKEWSRAGETLPEARRVVLQKVYRSTRQILEYIRGLGYSIEIPVDGRDGPPVKEQLVASAQAELTYIQALLSESDEGLTGILGKSDEYLALFKEHLGEHKNLRIMNMAEAQGVEFDRVILVGLKKTADISREAREALSPKLETERRRVMRDVLYVALTRAIRELHVLSEVPLSEIINSLG